MLYRCFIRGENFPGENCEYGFYTNRWIEAKSKRDAERLALEHLRSDPDLQLDSWKERDKAKTPDQKRARIFFEEIVPVRTPKTQFQQTGLVWFEMEEQIK